MGNADQGPNNELPGVKRLFGKGLFPGTIRLSRKGAEQPNPDISALTLDDNKQPSSSSTTIDRHNSAKRGDDSTPQPSTTAATTDTDTTNITSQHPNSPKPSPSPSIPRSMTANRLNKFDKLLSEPVLNLEALKELCWSGIPPHHRSLCWRLLLGYLPPNKDRRSQILERRRREYRDMVPDYYDSVAAAAASSPPSSLSAIAAAAADVVEDGGALRQVAVDVPRTAPGVAFFHIPQVQKSLERILYIWGVRHPASGYVQGINDLVTPFLAVFMSEHMHQVGPIETWADESSALPSQDTFLDVEADSYWCLCKLLDSIQDHYTYAQPGIQRMLFHVRELVRRVDEPLAQQLDKEGLDFIQFAFRWVNCLLLREVPFQLGIRLWDTYLSEGGSGLKGFLVYVLGSFLLSWQDELRGMEFQELIMFLQRLPTSEWEEKDIETVLSRAHCWRISFVGTGHFQ